YGACVDIFFFFFQAEDGIRDSSVTGVQTCALPISVRWTTVRDSTPCSRISNCCPADRRTTRRCTRSSGRCIPSRVEPARSAARRSEERRVGKEGRARERPSPERRKAKAEKSADETC